MEKIGEFLDNFRNNLIVEFNKNTILKQRLVPYSKTYHFICTGDRVINYYLNKINSIRRSPYIPPKSPDIKQPTSGLPSLYNFSVKNLVLNGWAKIKNLFFNKESSLKFYVEDYLIQNFCDTKSYTEEGSKDFELLQMEFNKDDLRDISKIEYLGNGEFLFEALFKEPLVVKIKVEVNEDGIKIDSLSYSKDL